MSTFNRVSCIMILVFASLVIFISAECEADTKPSPAEIARRAAAEGKLVYKLIDHNKDRDILEQIRVVSISTGMFPQQANFDRWQETLARAEKNGVLVVTCDPAFLRYGTLTRISDQDPDTPSSYRRGRYGHMDNALLIPAGNRTIASHHGPDVYTYDRTGGMSWAVPYMAGLAALAYQVKPQIDPKTIVDLWLKTATQTDVGPIVNPVGFIEAVRKMK